MGTATAVAFAQAVQEGLSNLDAVLLYHLTANHYPPLPASLVPTAKLAIEAAEAEEWDKQIELPEGVTYKDQSSAPASACIDAWHLDAFVTSYDDYGEE